MLPLDELSTISDTNGQPRIDGFVHLNALKVDWGSTVKLNGAWLTPKPALLAVDAPAVLPSAAVRFYNLSGQQVSPLRRSADGRLLGKKGIYIVNGRKVIVK